MSKNWYFNVGKGLLYNIKHPYYIKISNNYIIKEFLQYMTEDKLEKGQQLLNELNSLKREKSNWEIAYSFYQIKVNVRSTYNSTDERMINTSLLNFEDIKLLVLAKFNKRIEEIQKEFDLL